MAAFVSVVPASLVNKDVKLFEVDSVKTHLSRRNARAIVVLKDSDRDMERGQRRAQETMERAKDDVRDYTKKFGWTDYAEIVNARFAMFGFVLALVTEIISPAHPSLTTQLHYLLPFLPNWPGPAN
mmetsp:Transcript_6467/g.11689  ORF Transcript_6467/g.11689 Transcript_6467/m.11689 type:complete len:126 (+) Transcript_6467:216-593(+)